MPLPCTFRKLTIALYNVLNCWLNEPCVRYWNHQDFVYFVAGFHYGNKFGLQCTKNRVNHKVTLTKEMADQEQLTVPSQMPTNLG